MNTTFERTDSHDEWLTPPEIVKALGDFDLDPCAPVNGPWRLATQIFTKADDGLAQEWSGRVFCNPPYGTQTRKWLNRCARHGNAVALTFARTETQMFFESVWPQAHAVLFVEGRIKFIYVSGERSRSPAGAPSILIAYDEANADALEKSTIRGKFIRLKGGRELSI
jgi:hypothetical protein